jgi:predicted ATP-dependent endonuclease of OLD family
MKLLKFRIQNYKTIQDSGWIDCEDVTAFVGKNEAGKTSLLRALSKLKSTDKTEYDPVKEFPHGRYTDEFKKKDWQVASAVFVLSKDEVAELAGIHEAYATVVTAEVTKTYGGKYSVGFEPAPQQPTTTSKEWASALKEVSKVAERILPAHAAGTTPDQQAQVQAAWSQRQSTIVRQFTTWLANAENEKLSPEAARIQEARKFVLDHTTDAWSRTPLDPVINQFDVMLEKCEKEKKLGEGRNWVVQHMPSFLFFTNYEMLQSDIYLPEFLTRASGQRRSAETRVQQALFKHVGVDAADLSNLSQTRSGPEPRPPNEDANIRRRIDELTIKANSASQAMTRKFGDWWQQRDHTFHYEFNGDYFRIWVSDNLNPSKVELEERSEGFRYFFSFYLLFLVEAEESHRNCILLLDEPGLHLHGTAQMKLIRFFDTLAEQGNQVLYTTHSPFLVDGDHLERARAVYEAPTGTIVSDDVWPKDADSLFPLQAALGYSICQSLFIAKNQVVVEGVTDYMLLTALNVALPDTDRLRRDVVLLPIGGAANFVPFVALLSSHGVKFVAIPDSDSAGQKAKASLEKLRQIIGSKKGHTTSFHELTGKSSITELEEIIPEAYYLAAVAKAYPTANLSFSAEEIKQTPSVVDRCKMRVQAASGEKFNKLAPIQTIVSDLHAKSPNTPKELLETGAKVFSHLNGFF